MFLIPWYAGYTVHNIEIKIRSCFNNFYKFNIYVYLNIYRSIYHRRYIDV